MNKLNKIKNTLRSSIKINIGKYKLCEQKLFGILSKSLECEEILRPKIENCHI